MSADGEPQREQGRSDTDRQFPAIRVEGVQLAVRVGQNVDLAIADPEPPRLAVVQRRREDSDGDASG